jgi:hypothetical protein
MWAHPAHCDHPSIFCEAGNVKVDYVENYWCPDCDVKIDLDCAPDCNECCKQPCGGPYSASGSDSASGDDAVPSGDDGQIVCSPSWASLNTHNLAAKSMTTKAKFNGDALHDDRIRIHQGIDRSIQLCVTDSQGRLLAVPSEDGIEICLPGVSLDLGHFSLDLLPSMLFEQTALSSEISDF